MHSYFSGLDIFIIYVYPVLLSVIRIILQLLLIPLLCYLK